jgi:hypothetical protein
MSTPSVLLIPDLLKAGKLYSQIPNSGAVDFDVTRATTAYRTNASGVLESVASGVPRLDYPIGGGCPSLLVEPAATNLVLRSEQFNDASWLTADTTVTANAETSPSGALTADTMTVSTSDSAVRQVTALGAGTYTFSVFVKLTAQTTAGLVRLQAQVDGSNVSSFFIPTTEWQRVTLTVTAVTNVTLVRIRGLAFVGTLAIWGAQLETGSVATSYIPTVAATATRNADVISKTGVSGFIGQTEGTVYAEWDISRLVLGNFGFAIDNGSVTEYIIIQRIGLTSVFQLSIKKSSGVNVNLITSSAFSTGIFKVACGYKNGDYALYVNGSQIGTSSNSTDFPTGALSRLVLSNNQFGFPNNGIRTAAIYPIRLTNSQLSSLTTL